ncbi:unnamed protein product, partial [Amoebophrya sp. A120]
SVQDFRRTVGVMAADLMAARAKMEDAWQPLAESADKSAANYLDGWALAGAQSTGPRLMWSPRAST